MDTEKLRLTIIVGTRPEIIKLSAVIKNAETFFETILVHTGQNYDYELNKVFFEELEIRKPDYYLGVVGSHLGETMGNVIAKSYALMEKTRPDALLVLGDTNSCLCVIAAKRLKIPVFHMEAGNRCKDENLPEEVIRRIVDVTSDVNLCYSEHARRYILQSGVRPEYTFVVGSPMAEVLTNYQAKIEESSILSDLALEPGKYFLLSAHREENIDNEKNFYSLVEAINAVADAYRLPVLYSCHPRSQKFIEKRGVHFRPNVIRHKPLGFFDYNKLQREALCVISDSGTLPEEAAFHGFPAVSIRTSTERPEAVDSGAFVVGSISEKALRQAIELAVRMKRDGIGASPVSSYEDRNVSSKVLKIIQSYTAVINRMVWRK